VYIRSTEQGSLLTTRELTTHPHQPPQSDGWRARQRAQALKDDECLLPHATVGLGIIRVDDLRSFLRTQGLYTTSQPIPYHMIVCNRS
jgi:hypothetical protein